MFNRRRTDPDFIRETTIGAGDLPHAINGVACNSATYVINWATLINGKACDSQLCHVRDPITVRLGGYDTGLLQSLRTTHGGFLRLFVAIALLFFRPTCSASSAPRTYCGFRISCHDAFFDYSFDHSYTFAPGLLDI